MTRVLLLAALAFAARSQTADPIQTELDAVNSARDAGSFAEAAAHRDAARRLVENTPLAEHIQDVVNLYLDAGRSAEGRAILRRAIAAQPDSAELRIALADSLEGEGNLLQAAAVLQGVPGSEAQVRLAGISRRLGRRTTKATNALVRLTLSTMTPKPAESFTELTLSPAQTAVIDARARLREGRIDDSFALALQAISSAANSSDTYIFDSTPALARMLARAGARGMADQLWERLFAAARDRSIDTLEPLLSISREHVRYLMQYPDRTAAARIALAEYHDLLVTAHGADSGTLTQVLRMTIDFEQDHDPQTAARAAQELIALEASLSGPDSLPMRHAIQVSAALRQMQRQ